jgi:hypothetical protein
VCSAIYNLALMQQLEDRGEPARIRNCNQLNACCAADAYARINGLGAMIVTQVNGEFSTPRRQNQPIDPRNGILRSESTFGLPLSRR